MDRISCTERVKSEEVLHRVKKKREQPAFSNKKANWIVTSGVGTAF